MSAISYALLRRFLHVLLLVLFCVSCGGGDDPPTGPSILEQPQSLTVREGASASFSVLAQGSAPLAYQWRRNGADIAGANGATYAIARVSASDNNAQFTVVVSNRAGEVTSRAATLTVEVVAAPVITSQPSDVSVVAPASATFSVAATGTEPLSYQWFRNGVALAGANSASFTTPSTSLSDTGTIYSVAVSNVAGVAVSDGALLAVTSEIEAPMITTQPASTTVAAGQSATFTVTATGTSPLAYQWRRDGADIAGATSARYTAPPAAQSDNGARFSVVVSNAHPSPAVSADATLTVAAAWSGIREDGARDLSFDAARAVASDSQGNVVIAGTADNGSFASDPPGLHSHAFVAKYSAAGELLWAHRFPVAGNIGAPDEANGVATDSSGNIYVAGHTQGTFAGQQHAGGTLDVALLKYDRDGNLLWARQFGSDNEDYGRAIAVDKDGNAFIVGNTWGQLPLQPETIGEVFIAKFDANGNRLWIRQWGSGGDGANRDAGRGVAVDAAGNAYMAGYIPFSYANTTPGGSGDGFAAKYDTDGNQAWFTRLRGLGPDDANAIAVAADGNTIYLTGRTNSDFGLPGWPAQDIFCCGTPDAFIARLDGAGAIRWALNLSSVPQPGPTHFLDIGAAIATDADGGSAYIAGYTTGTMPGETTQESQDIFVARYDSDGARAWVRQFGGALPALGVRNDAAYGIALDGAGDVIVAGEVFGTFGTPNPDIDRTDWFVMKLNKDDGRLR